MPLPVRSDCLERGLGRSDGGFAPSEYRVWRGKATPPEVGRPLRCAPVDQTDAAAEPKTAVHSASTASRSVCSAGGVTWVGASSRRATCCTRRSSR